MALIWHSWEKSRNCDSKWTWLKLFQARIIITKLLAVNNDKVSVSPLGEDLLGKPHPAQASALKGHVDLDGKADHTAFQRAVAQKLNK